MKRLAVILAVLGFAAPAFAAAPAELNDSQLDQVAAGGGSLALPATNINVNASPIIVTQTAVALNFQNQTGNFHGKGKAKGLQKQHGFAVASNVAKINYHVVQVNGG
jgi:hypothetical protein